MNIGIVKVEQGKALIRSNVFSGEVQVSFTGGFVWPVIHKAEIMDISVKTIELDRSGADGLICRDNIRADIKITFFVRVNKTENDVIKVAQSIGCTRAFAPPNMGTTGAPASFESPARTGAPGPTMIVGRTMFHWRADSDTTRSAAIFDRA